MKDSTVLLSMQKAKEEVKITKLLTCNDKCTQKIRSIFLSVIVYHTPEISRQGSAPFQPVFSQNATESTDLCKKEEEKKRKMNVDMYYYIIQKIYYGKHIVGFEKR